MFSMMTACIGFCNMNAIGGNETIIVKSENRILSEKNCTIEFSLDNLKIEEESVIFSAKVRADDKGFGKLEYDMKVFVNDEILRPNQLHATRLLNRDLLIKTFSAEKNPPEHGSPGYMIKSLFREKVGGGTKKEAEKTSECKEGVWLVRHSKDFVPQRKDFQTNGKDFDYKWDITDMLKKGINKITVKNVNPDKDACLEIKTEISLLKRKSMLPALKEAQNKVFPSFTPIIGNVDFKFLEDGKIEWNSGSNTLLSDLQIKILKNGIKTSLELKPEKSTSNAFSYNAENIRLVRSVDESKGSNTFILKDTITSISSNSLIFRVDNIQQYLFPISDIKVAGLSYPSWLCRQRTFESPEWKHKMLWRRFSSNPTLFIKSAFSSGGIGFFLLDSDSRNHHTFNLCIPENREVGWEAGWYELKPGEKMELCWEISFIGNGDYFSFINKIRDELGLNNVTIEGSFDFVSLHDIAENMTDDEILNAIKKHNVKYLITWGGYLWPDPNKNPPPYDLIFGTTIMYPKYAGYLEEIGKAVARMKKLAPSVKVLPYFHLTLFGTPEADDIKKYSSEICKNPDGTINGRTWGVKNTNSNRNKNTCSVSMIPKKDASYGRELMRTLNYYIDKLKVDGFFFDEFSGELYDFNDINNGNNECNYVEITSDGKIYRIRSIGVHANDFVYGVLQKMKEKKLSVFGNGGNLDLRLRGINNCPVFSEARLSLYQPAYSVHLDTPIALWYRPNVQTVRMILDEGLIPGGTALNWTQNLTAHIYPITPQQIGKGFVIGKEVIVSAVKTEIPDNFANENLEEYSYMPDGTMKEGRINYMKSEKLKVPDNGFVILRKDLK